MKHYLVCITIATMVFAGTVQGQNTSHATDIKIGIGASVNASSIITFDLANANVVFPVGFMNILIPISFPNFRLEPEFGDFAMTTEVKIGAESMTERQGVIRLGLAAHYVHSFGDRSQFYIGPRFVAFMVNSSSSATTNPDDEEENWTDILIGASVGGEYLFSEHFSIGAEVQLNYITHGDPEVKPEPIVNREESGSILSNNAALIVRWYFN